MTLAYSHADTEIVQPYRNIRPTGITNLRMIRDDRGKR